MATSPSTSQYDWSGHDVGRASQSFGTVFHPFTGILQSSPYPLRGVIQNTLQSPEQPTPVFIPADIAALTPTPLRNQLYASPQLVDLTLQGQIYAAIKTAEDFPSPLLRNQLYASPQYVDLTVQPAVTRVDIPSTVPTVKYYPQNTEYFWPGHYSSAAAAQSYGVIFPPFDAALTLSLSKVPNRPSTFMSGPQMVDTSLFPSMMFGMPPPSSGGVGSSNLHDYNLGLSLMILGGFRL